MRVGALPIASRRAPASRRYARAAAGDSRLVEIDAACGEAAVILSREMSRPSSRMSARRAR